MSPAPQAPSAGAGATAASETAAAATPKEEYVQVPFNIGLFPSFSLNSQYRGKKIENRVSISGGWSRVAKLDGIAGAFFATIVEEEARGVTWSMGANLAGTHHGAQLTHGYNHADVLRGIQVGAVNHAQEARGVQAGLVNVGGRVRGVQVGLINYAEEADVSLALLPITKKGGVHPEIFTSDTALLGIGLRLPANYTYAFFAAGLHPIGRRNEPVVALATDEKRGQAMEIGGGFGLHIPVHRKAFLDVDISAYGVTSGLDFKGPFANMSKLRLMVGWQPAERLSVFAGPTFNAMIDNPRRAVARPGYGWVAGSQDAGKYRIRYWPGFVAGMRF